MRRQLLETPTLSANGALVGRPRKLPPPDAVERIRDLAADGWSLIGIARKLTVTAEILRRWLTDYPQLQEAFEFGRECERHVLHNVLYRIAVEGENDRDRILAAQTILNSRHGYRTDTSDTGARVAVQINLPGARPLSDFVEITNADGTQHHRLPTPSP